MFAGTQLPPLTPTPLIRTPLIRMLGRFAWVCVLCVHPSAVPGHCRADDGPAAANGFRVIVQEHTRQTIERVVQYLDAHPEAGDRYEAAGWLLTAVRQHAWESKVLGVTSKLLDDSELPARLRLAALEVHCLGLADSGEAAQAVDAFQARLASVRLREPGGIIDLTRELGARLMAAGETGAARSVYEDLARRLFLNPEVREFCDVRLARLDLVGKPAPEFSVRNLDGELIDEQTWRGKVVVLDFWATNCAPCLAEFPEMQRLYRERHADGLEMLGLSLDAERQHVEMFQRERALPWDLAWSPPDVDRLRGRYHVPLIPAVFVIDREGHLVCFDVAGPTLERVVARLLSDAGS